MIKHSLFMIPLPIDLLERAVRQINVLERRERRELIGPESLHGVVGQADGLEAVVAVERLGVEGGQVVVAQVEAGHDLEIPEKSIKMFKSITYRIEITKARKR